MPVPVRTTEFPVAEPNFLGRAVHVLEIVNARVGEQRLEPVRVAGDPVGHVAAIGSACRTHAGRIEPAVARERRIQAVHEVRVGLSTPVSRNLVGELLSVTERTTRIDRNDSKSRRSEELEIPAAVPLIQPLALWSAVNKEENGKLLARLVLRWSYDQSLHAVTLGTLEPEVFDRIQLELGEKRVVLVGEMPNTAEARWSDRREIHFGGTLGRVLQPRNRFTVARHRRREVIAPGGEQLRRRRPP